MAVTKDDVIAAYRMLLGREASEHEAGAWLHVASVADLRKRFIASTEFESQLRAHASIAAAQPRRLPLDVPAISVEWETEPNLQALLLDYVAETWTALGREEPHWSVLSSDTFKAHNIEQSAPTFYASGANDAKLVAAILARHSITPTELPRVVEYGCGVGRVTPHLAAVFGEVIGVDISESHLHLAGEAVYQSGRKNVRLMLARAPDFGMQAPFDLWFSHIVLQHNTPPIMAMVLRRMFAQLAPGGVAIFQVPTYVPGYAFDVRSYLASPRSGAIEVHCLPQEVVFRLAEERGCVPMEVREDAAMGYPWLSNVFAFRKPR